MVLQHINSETIGIKTTQAMIQLKHMGMVKIGERELPGPGEYDVAGIGVHISPAVAFLYLEGMRVAVVWDKIASFNQEEESDIQVYIILHNDAPAATALIKEQDPRLVILHDAVLSEVVTKEDGVTIQPESNFKITAQTLPVDERQFILLV